MNDGIVIYHRVVHCSVCVPHNMPISEIEKLVSENSPTELGHSWSVSSSPTFSGVAPNPCQCEIDQARLHYLMVY